MQLVKSLSHPRKRKKKEAGAAELVKRLQCNGCAIVLDNGVRFYDDWNIPANEWRKRACTAPRQTRCANLRICRMVVLFRGRSVRRAGSNPLSKAAQICTANVGAEVQTGIGPWAGRAYKGRNIARMTNDLSLRHIGSRLRVESSAESILTQLEGDELMPVTTRPTLSVNHALTAQMRGRNYFRAATFLPGKIVATMDAAQPWDALLDAVYSEGGLVLEVDDFDRVRRVYERPRDSE